MTDRWHFHVHDNIQLNVCVMCVITCGGLSWDPINDPCYIYVPHNTVTINTLKACWHVIWSYLATAVKWDCESAKTKLYILSTLTLNVTLSEYKQYMHHNTNRYLYPQEEQRTNHSFIHPSCQPFIPPLTETIGCCYCVYGLCLWVFLPGPECCGLRKPAHSNKV